MADIKIFDNLEFGKFEILRKLPQYQNGSLVL